MAKFSKLVFGFIEGHFPGTLISICVFSFTSFSKSKLRCKEVDGLSRGYLSETIVTKREMTDNLHFLISCFPVRYREIAMKIFFDLTLVPQV